MERSGFRNTLLKNLSPEVIQRLQLRPVSLPRGRNLQVPGEAAGPLYFLEEGIGSMTACFASGAQVEVSMFGNESVIGMSALMGAKIGLNRTFMQMAGGGYTCSIPHAREEFQQNGDFQRLALRYVQCQLTLNMQNAACNAIHTHEQRLARWLLICSDRAKRSTLEFAHELVAEMLGSTRSTISIAAGHFKCKGLIEYSRGHVQILDRPSLEAESCECYRVVRDHLENFAEFDTGFAM